MREHAGIASGGATLFHAHSKNERATEEKALTPCTEIIRRYELLRYNLHKEKYEKHVKYSV